MLFCSERHVLGALLSQPEYGLYTRFVEGSKTKIADVALKKEKERMVHGRWICVIMVIEMRTLVSRKMNGKLR
jgi:hypothetical protein